MHHQGSPWAGILRMEAKLSLQETGCTWASRGRAWPVQVGRTGLKGPTGPRVLPSGHLPCATGLGWVSLSVLGSFS